MERNEMPTSPEGVEGESVEEAPQGSSGGFEIERFDRDDVGPQSQLEEVRKELGVPEHEPSELPIDFKSPLPAEEGEVPVNKNSLVKKILRKFKSWLGIAGAVGVGLGAFDASADESKKDVPANGVPVYQKEAKSVNAPNIYSRGWSTNNVPDKPMDISKVPGANIGLAKENQPGMSGSSAKKVEAPARPKVRAGIMRSGSSLSGSLGNNMYPGYYGGGYIPHDSISRLPTPQERQEAAKEFLKHPTKRQPNR